jgi:hypothetical protein
MDIPLAQYSNNRNYLLLFDWPVKAGPVDRRRGGLEQR